MAGVVKKKSIFRSAYWNGSCHLARNWQAFFAGNVFIQSGSDGVIERTK